MFGLSLVLTPNLINVHHDLSQQALVEGCLAGNRDMQYALYQKYARAMYNLCLRLTGHAHDAEDALQQAFVEVFTKLDSFRGESTLGAWIKRVVINTTINTLNKRRLPTDAWDELQHDRTDDAALDPDSHTSYQIDAIKHAIDALPDGYRVVLTLYLLEGYDHEEIGQILNISEQTSKSQYSRAKARLRATIDSKAFFD